MNGARNIPVAAAKPLEADPGNHRNRAVPEPGVHKTPGAERGLEVALLTGGGDRPYALGLTSTLVTCGVSVDFIGSDDLDLPELHCLPRVNFLNLRGDQRPNVSRWGKDRRVLVFYSRLIYYAATARPRIFHILWNNKFEFFDRTILMLYYRLLGRRIVFTAHNVNSRRRDLNDTCLNRLSLSLQYKLADHIFVHTTRMKDQLADEFAVSPGKISVIPFGINNTVPATKLTGPEARQLLGIGADKRVLLFFGRIARYKGLEYLLAALADLSKADRNYQVIIAGSVKDCAEYWNQITNQILNSGIREDILERIEFIPDSETELYFKAADALVLPYVEIFQSGVLVLAYSFGLPVIAADVGSLREDIVEGETGYVFRPKDPVDLAAKVEHYFSSALFRDLETRRQGIQDYANTRHSWGKVGERTLEVYRMLAGAR